MFHDLGFIVLCPSMKIIDLTKTLDSVQTYVNPENVVCVIPPTKDAIVQNQFGQVCTSYRAKSDTICSMLNKGAKYAKCDWNMVLYAGTRIRSNLSQKMLPFRESPDDILYPTSTNLDVWNSSLNGWLFHKQLFKKVGEFYDFETFEFSKIGWIAQAVEAGAIFKGIVGFCIR